MEFNKGFQALMERQKYLRDMRDSTQKALDEMLLIQKEYEPMSKGLPLLAVWFCFIFFLLIGCVGMAVADGKPWYIMASLIAGGFLLVWGFLSELRVWIEERRSRQEYEKKLDEQMERLRRELDECNAELERNERILTELSTSF